MQINIHSPDIPLPGDRGYVITMSIKSFKGRREVEVHLFRSQWDDEEMDIYDWDVLIGKPLPGSPGDKYSSRRVILESFTEDERDRIVDFLKKQYATRLESIEARTLDFPVPLGLPALSDMEAGKDIGFILFEKIPSYNLGIPLSGLFDLSQHEPMVRPQD